MTVFNCHGGVGGGAVNLLGENLKKTVFSATFVNNNNDNITIPALTLFMVFTVRSEAATGIRTGFVL